MKKIFFLVIYLIIFLSRIVAKEEIVFENTYQPNYHQGWDGVGSGNIVASFFYVI